MSKALLSISLRCMRSQETKTKAIIYYDTVYRQLKLDKQFASSLPQYSFHVVRIVNILVSENVCLHNRINKFQIQFI